ncbi:hypothetical protein AVEN_83171-1 [Araneus ventricosus]|uniref:BTB domain-containing protein n=1 Tax=Araneus ventricosus TaxID=182803 RepID=A0A4Y2APE9_ARAVE|nr:hypothetical protein AVEN_83171-1 [Araneus ventricosus]
MAQYIGAGDENFGALEDFCDAILKTEDGCAFKVHRVVLSKNSSYFTALFLFDGRDQSNAEFSLSWFNGQAVKKVLHYLYTGKVFLEADIIAELLLAADYFLLDDLLFECQTFAKEHLSLTNCVEIFMASHINDRLELFKCSRRFIYMNFSKLLHGPTNEFADIPLELFKILLEDIVFLNISDDTSIWLSVEQWVGNSSERLPVVPELLNTIRFRNFNSHLVQYLQKSDILRKNPCLKELNNILLTAKLPELGAIFKNELSYKYPKTDLDGPRQPKRLYLIANITIDGIDLYIAYNEDICIRRKITSQTKNDFKPLHMVVVDHLAYMFEFPTGRGIVFHLLEKTWNEMEIMNRPHENRIIIQKGQFIYVVGEGINTSEDIFHEERGEDFVSAEEESDDIFDEERGEDFVSDEEESDDSFDEERGEDFVSDDTLCTFERYDTKNQTWEHLGSLPNSVAAASIGNKIYIHSESSSNVMTMQEYDTISGTFSNIPAPGRSGVEYIRPNMIEYDNQLFFIEGSVDDGSLKSVEVFSPETRVWKNFQSLPYG